MQGEVNSQRRPPYSIIRERRLADLARRQHGVVTRRQARELGFANGAVDHRLDSRSWRALHRGVFQVGAGPLTSRGRWLAAVLACGNEALLSHWTAAALWEIGRERGAQPHVSAPDSRGKRPGVIVHRVVPLPRAERGTRAGIPVTSVPRTLLDIARMTDRTALRRVVDEADRVRLLRVRDVLDLLARRRGHAGTRLLAEVIAAHTEPLGTRSELEARFIDLLSEAHLPLPVVNAHVLGLEVDCLWPRERLVVELDGWSFHRTRNAFEVDHGRDTRLRLAGYEVLRFTWRQVRGEPAMVVTVIRRALEERAEATAVRRAR